MMLHVSADVAGKYFFNRPIIGTLETASYYYMVAVVFLPLAAVEARHEHVAVDLFVVHAPPVLRRLAYIGACLISLGFFAALTWRTGLDAVAATASGETIMANFTFYVWPSRWLLPIGFAAIFLTLVLHLWRALAEPDFHDRLADGSQP